MPWRKDCYLRLCADEYDPNNPKPQTLNPVLSLQDCYLRFCADEYDPNNLDIFMHLSNNSIAKYYEGETDGKGAEHSRGRKTVRRRQHFVAAVGLGTGVRELIARLKAISF